MGRGVPLYFGIDNVKKQVAVKSGFEKSQIWVDKSRDFQQKGLTKAGQTDCTETAYSHLSNVGQ